MASNAVVILDGGLATELIKLGHEIDSLPLWSAMVLMSSPESIAEVHRNYLNCGSQVITTASYQASVEGFQKHCGITADRAYELLHQSVTLAVETRDTYCRENRIVGRAKPLVAASVGPYGAMLADGSEYNGNYVDHMTVEELMNWHRPRLNCLVNGCCDLVAFETIPALKEGLALLQLLQEFPNSKAWISFSCQEPGFTVHQDEIKKTIKTCISRTPKNQLIAIGVNCCPPSVVESLLKDASEVCEDIPLLVYPNSGEKWQPNVGWLQTETIKPVFSDVQKWVDLGARWIGGCCRTSPEDIRSLKNLLNL